MLLCDNSMVPQANMQEPNQMFNTYQVAKDSKTPYSDATKTKKHVKGHVKRPMNGFMVFSQVKRREIVKETPDKHNAEISKQLGRDWKQMSSNEKQVYMDKAEELRKLHELEYPNYKYRPKKKQTKTSKSANSSKSSCGSPASTSSISSTSGSSMVSNSSNSNKRRRSSGSRKQSSSSSSSSSGSVGQHQHHQHNNNNNNNNSNHQQSNHSISVKLEQILDNSMMETIETAGIKQEFKDAFDVNDTNNNHNNDLNGGRLASMYTFATTNTSNNYPFSNELPIECGGSLFESNDFSSPLPPHSCSNTGNNELPNSPESAISPEDIFFSVENGSVDDVNYYLNSDSITTSTPTTKLFTNKTNGYGNGQNGDQEPTLSALNNMIDMEKSTSHGVLNFNNNNQNMNNNSYLLNGGMQNINATFQLGPENALLSVASFNNNPNHIYSNGNTTLNTLALSELDLDVGSSNSGDHLEFPSMAFCMDGVGLTFD